MKSVKLFIFYKILALQNVYACNLQLGFSLQQIWSFICSLKKKKFKFYHWQLFSLNLTPTNTFWYVKKKGKKKKEKFNIYFKIRIFKAVTDQV